MARPLGAVLMMACALGLLATGTAPASALAPEPPPPAAIDQAYRELGGAAGGLGAGRGSVVCGLRDGGCYRHFAHGAITWSPESGAHPTWGAIRTAWAELSHENGPLGYPTDTTTCSGGGCVQHFQRGTISWSAPEGAHVQLDIDDPTGTSVVVNKQRPLQPADYAPEPLAAVDGVPMRADTAQALGRLKDAAAADGVAVNALSGYRSYETQSGLYTGYIASYGQETADSISARPGHSEHQTGLAVDIANPDGTCSLETCFGDTPAGAWAAENAHRFGFIIRYPDGATPVTGYAYEPWHLRYVGEELAGQMHRGGAGTLEGYMGLPAAADY